MTFSLIFRRKKFSVVWTTEDLEPAGSLHLLITHAEESLVNSAFLGCHTQDFSAITVDSKLFCKHSSDCLTTASILSCHCNYNIAAHLNRLLFS